MLKIKNQINVSQRELQRQNQQNFNKQQQQEQVEYINQKHQQYQDSKAPITYYDLIQKVGTDGPYQRNIFILFFCNWFITAILLLQTAFLFMNNSFDCQSFGLVISNCEEAVCKMTPEQQVKYIKNIDIKTLSTEFGPFMCEDAYIISQAKTVLFGGALFGYLFFLFFTDNFGRKFSVLLTWGSCCLGVVLLVCSQNFAMACVGLFFAGSGCEAATRVNMTMFAQVFDFYKRQKYSVAIQFSFGIAGILIAILYYVVQDWRIINIFMLCVPSLVIFLFFIFYLEQTPRFLVKKGKQKTVKSLNRIGKINKNIQNIISIEDVQRVMQNQGNGKKQDNKKMTVIDVFKYKSLRLKAIGVCLIFFAISYLYDSPTFIVDQLHLSPNINLVVLSISEITAYIVAIPFITRLSRVKTGVISFLLAGLISSVLILYQKPDDCGDICVHSVVQIINVFLMRFVVSFYYCVLFLFVNQMFPTRIRGIGFGVASAVGAASSTLGNLIIVFLNSNKLSPHLMNVPLALLAILALCLTPQTLNKPFQEQIHQIMCQKLKQQQKYLKDKNENQ